MVLLFRLLRFLSLQGESAMPVAHCLKPVARERARENESRFVFFFYSARRWLPQLWTCVCVFFYVGISRVWPGSRAPGRRTCVRTLRWSHRFLYVLLCAVSSHLLLVCDALSRLRLHTQRLLSAFWRWARRFRSTYFCEVFERRVLLLCLLAFARFLPCFAAHSSKLRVSKNV